MTIDEMIEVLQAYKDGKTVQIRRKGGWHDMDFDSECIFGFVNYRVKPEPFECWVNQFSSGLAYGPWLTYEEAKKWATGSIRTIHMREVVDE